jgi:hypothetical protein
MNNKSKLTIRNFVSQYSSLRERDMGKRQCYSPFIRSLVALSTGLQELERKQQTVMTTL